MSGTTDSLDSPAHAGPVLVADLFPTIANATLRAANVRADQILRGGYGTPGSDATAGPLTITAAQVIAGILVRDPNGAGRTDTLPTAALLVAALTRPAVGDVLRFTIVNGADAAEAITIAAGTGGAFDANQTAASRVIAQNSTKTLLIRLTNVTASSEAYVVYC